MASYFLNSLLKAFSMYVALLAIHNAAQPKGITNQSPLWTWKQKGSRCNPLSFVSLTIWLNDIRFRFFRAFSWEHLLFCAPLGWWWTGSESSAFQTYSNVQQLRLLWKVHGFHATCDDTVWQTHYCRPEISYIIKSHRGWHQWLLFSKLLYRTLWFCREGQHQWQKRFLKRWRRGCSLLVDLQMSSAMAIKIFFYILYD